MNILRKCLKMLKSDKESDFDFGKNKNITLQ